MAFHFPNLAIRFNFVQDQNIPTRKNVLVADKPTLIRRDYVICACLINHMLGQAHFRQNPIWLGLILKMDGGLIARPVFTRFERWIGLGLNEAVLSTRSLCDYSFIFIVRPNVFMQLAKSRRYS